MFPTQFTSASFTWERKELNNILKINSGRDYKQLNSGNIPVYGTGGYMLSVNDKLSDTDAVGIGRKGTIDKPLYLKAPFWTVDTLFYCTSKENSDVKFIYLLFQIINWKRYDESTGVPSLSKNTISNIKTYVPKIKEQDYISKLFFSLDNTLQLHENYLQLLYNFRSFLLQKMFSINDTFPNLRFKQFNDKWKYKKLGEVADIVSGGTPDTTKRDYWNGSINWYTPAEVGNKIFVGGSQRKITNIGLENSSAKILPVGTVLFTSRAGIGKTAILKEKGSTNQGFQSIVPKKKSLDSYFIFSMSNILKKYGESHGAGSTFLEISGKELAKARISLPSITEQKNISKVFFKLDTIITLQKQEIDNLKKLKQFLLQNMFI
ncbi:restriction endonuclease subunit S [Ligilactobacillus salivarius]|uniref:Restriction endonuclease subunit S n=1 Tax=Ligilactobacillus salivarius TaxID=1624 RepID=A0A1V9QTJ2_9LACO|nr:restriction endonuclease subunit S [Ligilactobacillus salivarius]OQQ84090.1 restriction endonuclease subunit S [Ligilactobacillus salivarius]OQQ86738.1 restriction endonuclease subunit S [Ligilactobacillus salivarius]